MGRRNAYLIGILLLCVSTGAILIPKGMLNTRNPDSLQNNTSEFITGNTADTGKEPERTENDTESIQNGKPEEDASLKEDNKVDDKDAAMDETDSKTADEADSKGASAEEVLSSIIINNTAEPEKLKNLLSEYPAGTKLPAGKLSDTAAEVLFYDEEISSAIKQRIVGLSYGKNCDIPYSKLRYVRVLYTGFDGNTYIGELIVNQAIAQDITDIFSDLYKIKYPIERMVLVDEYDADDIQSMAADNSSAFNYRYIDGTTRLSNHSEGRAIDINPLYNPYVRYFDGKEDVLPKNGNEYADRQKDCKYYIKKGDPCYEAFVKRGFTWGGEWTNSKDYQHFQKLDNR